MKITITDDQGVVHATIKSPTMGALTAMQIVENALAEKGWMVCEDCDVWLDDRYAVGVLHTSQHHALVCPKCAERYHPSKRV